ncbi:hypothetical protein SCHPADRAFT_932471 [Schizopora paradoxa]|uniref:G-patch domain-containing protein n=1 Tax=Schizopora paradoxa TaxID=27342 RepID=A0A0H2R690_9AGAM|nr:hypothetical protein SCHPADRAFT_932471 [Schizopora paradoxa]
MSYGREWDKGKDWNDEDYYGSTRGRAEDDDYGNYGEGKRRKYNNGGYEDSSWSQFNHNGRGQAGYDAQDAGGRFDNDPNYERQHRQGGGFVNRKKHVSSEPSPHVIFLGLDSDFTEADLFSFLKGQGCSPDTATIIRERNTGTCTTSNSHFICASKGFGFAQFNSTDEARRFVDPNFPFVTVPPPASHGASAAATFRAAMDAGLQHNGRRVKIDYSQSANLPDKGRKGPFASNDGTRDIGNTQAPVLLLRGLDPLSGTAAIAQAMKGSSGSNDGAKGMKRVILIKDKFTMASWGFAFVEFIDIRSASAVLAATMSSSLHPNGFRVSDKPVAASFAHPYSFQPLNDGVPDESCLHSSLSLGGIEDTWVKYWDENSTVGVMEFKVDEPVEAQVDTGKGKKEKRKTKNVTTEQVEASILPSSSKPVTLSFGKTLAPTTNNNGNGKPPGQLAQLGFSLNEDDGTDDEKQENEAGTSSNDPKLGKGAQTVAPMIASKKVVNNITKWNQVKDVKDVTTGSDETAVAISNSALKKEPEFVFSDTQAKTCLLCSRQFKSLDQLQRHNKESDLHKKNYRDASLREIAREKASALRQRETSEQQGNKYRDRASERRSLYNQPDVPVVDQPASNVTNKRHAEGPSPPPLAPTPPVAPAKDDSNIGNKLLKMMGWKEGSGLGLEGEGRVDPIEASIYASGVGLGASKGKEVSKYVDGFSGYVSMAKDSVRDIVKDARERYGS